MITLYTGTPGSGKSLHLIRVILRAVKTSYVICNFPIIFTPKEIKAGYDKNFFYWPNEKITVVNLIYFACQYGLFDEMKEDQCLVIIDEAGGMFNTREGAKKENAHDRKIWIDFFSQHRKPGFNFVLVAQNDKMIDRQIRGLIETEKRHRRMNNFKLFQLMRWPLFVSVEYWYAVTPKQKVQAEWYWFKPSYGKRYDTMKMFSGFGLSEEIMRIIAAYRQGKEIERNGDFDINIEAIYASRKEYKEDTDEKDDVA